MTVVQQRGIPPIKAGKDVLLKSQTGSGKTLTYVVPIINGLMTVSSLGQPVDSLWQCLGSLGQRMSGLEQRVSILG